MLPRCAGVVDAAVARFGRVDILVSNAGLGVKALDLDDALSASDADWQRMWSVHVMAHVHACRAVLPGMLERGSGYLVNVASAAGLLSQVGDTAYSVTKHAAVGLAESLAITYGDRGVGVSVVCPQYVATAMTGLDEKTAAGSLPGVLTVEQAASAIADGIERGQVPDPDSPGSARVLPEQGDRLRALARWHAPRPRPLAGRRLPQGQVLRRLRTAESPPRGEAVRDEWLGVRQRPRGWR